MLSTRLLSATALAGLLAAAPVAPLHAERSPFTDLPADHWAYPAVEKLVSRGILSGYPDGSFRGKNLVTRYALAVSLAKAIEEGVLQRPSNDSGSGGVGLSLEDLETLESLIKEFGDELALVGVKVAAVEEQLQNHQGQIDDLGRRVSDLEEGGQEEERALRVEGGRFRAIGYNRTALEGEVDTIVDLGVDVNEDVRGHVSLRYTNRMDQIDNEVFGTYEAYLESNKPVGPVDRVRVGKMNNFLGVGTVLFDRREGLELKSNRDDVDFELGYYDALLAHVSTDVMDEGRLGFYYLKQDRIANRRPGHLGVYAHGESGGNLGYAMEFTEYDNDGVTATNRDEETSSFYMGLNFKPNEADGMRLRLGYLVQGEDYRALAVDSDLRWQGRDMRVSPHHDLLQALRDATPAGVDPDAIPGFRDLQLGLDFRLPSSRWSGRANVDLVRGHSNVLNHGDDDFQVYTVAVERSLDQDLEVQLRWQGVSFDNENGNAAVDSLPALRRQDSSNLRAQVVKRF